MKEQFVTLDLAVGLRSIGFDEPCLAFFNTLHPSSLCFCDVFGFLEEHEDNVYTKNSIGNKVSAPLWQQAIIWLQENKHMYISPNWNSEIGKFEYFLKHQGEVIVYFQKEDEAHFDTWIQCVEAAILKSFEVL